MNAALKLALQSWAIAAAISFFVAVLIVVMTRLLTLFSKKK